jgi:hypothetical protein
MDIQKFLHGLIKPIINEAYKSMALEGTRMIVWYTESKDDEGGKLYVTYPDEDRPVSGAYPIQGFYLSVMDSRETMLKKLMDVTKRLPLLPIDDEKLVARVMKRALKIKSELDLSDSPEFTFKVGKDWMPDPYNPMDDFDLSSLIEDMTYQAIKDLGMTISKNDIVVTNIKYNPGERKWKNTLFTSDISIFKFSGSVKGSARAIWVGNESRINPEEFTVSF